MRLRELIRQNRKKIDVEILTVNPRLVGPITDYVRSEWVRSHEPLYRWAQQHVRGL